MRLWKFRFQKMLPKISRGRSLEQPHPSGYPPPAAAPPSHLNYTLPGAAAVNQAGAKNRKASFNRSESNLSHPR